LSNLLFLSYTDSREHQRDYLVSLVGFVTYPDLDYMLSIGRNHEEAVNHFTHQVISGDFGPDDSRDGRSSAFLKYTHVIPRAVSIVLENLLIDDEGNILNHDEAEERGAEYIRNNC
jgi:hypothetical protein